MIRQRWLERAVIVGVVLGILGTVLLWALPEIIRRVALDQIPKRTGRAVAIEDIDLNLFTGRFALKNFRLDEPGSAEAFITAERLAGRLIPSALLRSEIRVAEVDLVAPSVHVVRTRSNEFNFSDLLPRGTEPPPSAGRSRWTVTLDRLTMSRGSVRARDEFVSPPAEWSVEDAGIAVANLTTRKGATPGRVAVHAKINEAALGVTAESLRLDPIKAIAKVTLDGFEIRRVTPYVWAATPYRPKGGRLALALTARVDEEGEELKQAVVTGTVNVDGQAMTGALSDTPFAGVSRVAIEVKEADAIARKLTVASVAIDGLEVSARRDRNGVIDLVEIFTPKAREGAGASATRAAAAPVNPSPAERPAERKLFPVLRGLARGFEQITVERITLGPSTATFVDEAVTPVTKLPLTKLQATVTDLTWPAKGPAKLNLSTVLPGGGTVDVSGSVVPHPLDADVSVKLRNAPVTPYQAYIPVPAQLSGRFNGDSRNRIALKDGQMVLMGKGNSWAQDVEIRAPGEKRAPIRVAYMDLVGIDVDWPKHAMAAKATFRRPRLEVIRAGDGSFELRDLFNARETPDEQRGPYPSAAPRPAPEAAGEAKPKNLLDTLRVDIKEVRVEQGSVRFVDQSTKPAFSQDLSQLEVTVDNVNNRPGERAKVAVRSVVGGDSTLDVRGEVNSIGSPTFVEMVGELHRFRLASVDPYAAGAIGWIIKKGELDYKVRIKLDGDVLDATNEVVVGKLQVAPATGTDEVKQRIGLPLGMIVALVKDSKGEIHANVPVTGSIKDPKFDLRETIWTAVKNVLVNIVKSPVRALTGLFSGGGDKEDKVEEPKVEPVTFAAGSSVIAPDMEQHLQRVADFLRSAPFVNLELAPTATAADAAALKEEAVNTGLREFQLARGLKDQTALLKYFEAQLPGVKPPPTPEEQLALLREREPAPEGALADLAHRRAEATRERLVTAEGIASERLAIPAPKEAAAPPAAADGPGRVEFAVVPGGD